jgi:hypothetical protein
MYELDSRKIEDGFKMDVDPVMCLDWKGSINGKITVSAPPFDSIVAAVTSESTRRKRCVPSQSQRCLQNKSD